MNPKQGHHNAQESSHLHTPVESNQLTHQRDFATPERPSSSSPLASSNKRDFATQPQEHITMLNTGIKTLDRLIEEHQNALKVLNNDIERYTFNSSDEHMAVHIDFIMTLDGGPIEERARRDFERLERKMEDAELLGKIAKSEREEIQSQIEEAQKAKIDLEKEREKAIRLLSPIRNKSKETKKN